MATILLAALYLKYQKELIMEKFFFRSQ
ncbi:hypothetical protein MTBSS4_170041 [Magnetospirillum sp. SS-4]|nr:hypothetical protein MTBSS4_170041 [Magnetospirillum sp. SS-4]